MKFLILSISLFLNFTIASGNNTQVVFENTELCKKAYKNIIALRLDSGLYYLQQENKIHPFNNYIVYLYNYIDFLTVFTSGDMAYYEKNVKNSFSERIDLIEDSKTEDSPYFLFVQAEIYLHSAILSVQNKDYLTSVFHLRKALKKLEENQKIFPEFKENRKSLGLLLSILGSVPDNLKTGFSILGLNGNINEGMEMLKELSEDKSFIQQHETATIYAFMLFHLNNKKEEAWQILKKNSFFESNSLMDIYAIAHIGVYGFHNDEAIAAIKKEEGNEYYIKFPLLDYILGIGKTYRLDEYANFYFQRFINNYKGKDYLKSAYQKMAWNNLIKDDLDKYQENISHINKVGRSLIDADKQAEKEVYFLSPPNSILLKARLLSDGNYLDKAISLLKNHTVEDFLMPKQKVEYRYRLGRIYHKEKNYTKAIEYYIATINFNNKVEAYYAANACYMIGNIYETLSNNDEALKYYEKCLTINGYQYNNSIKQKAKAGVNRLKKSFF